MSLSGLSGGTICFKKIAEQLMSGSITPRVADVDWVKCSTFVNFLEGVYHGSDRHEPLLRCSASAFRRRWDAVISALRIPATAQLTPGGLRGGGCVSSFQKGTAIPLLLWRMRLRHQQTLGNYLQEAVAENQCCLDCLLQLETALLHWLPSLKFFWGCGPSTIFSSRSFRALLGLTSCTA